MQGTPGRLQPVWNSGASRAGGTSAPGVVPPANFATVEAGGEEVH